MSGGQERIDEMFAFVAVDPTDGTEGIISLGNIPMVGADLERVVSLESAAQMISNVTGVTITIVHFSQRTDGKIITPHGRPS